MCLAFKEETSKVIFRFVVPFANRLANLILADWLTNLQIGQIGRLFGTYLLPPRQRNWPLSFLAFQFDSACPVQHSTFICI